MVLIYEYVHSSEPKLSSAAYIRNSPEFKTEKASKK